MTSIHAAFSCYPGSKRRVPYIMLPVRLTFNRWKSADRVTLCIQLSDFNTQVVKFSEFSPWFQSFRFLVVVEWFCSDSCLMLLELCVFGWLLTQRKRNFPPKGLENRPPYGGYFTLPLPPNPTFRWQATTNNSIRSTPSVSCYRFFYICCYLPQHYGRSIRPRDKFWPRCPAVHPKTSRGGRKKRNKSKTPKSSSGVSLPLVCSWLFI